MICTLQAYSTMCITNITYGVIEMRTTIYVPDELVDGLKESAWVSRKSVSEYLLDLHKAAMIDSNFKYKDAKEIKKEMTPQEKLAEWKKGVNNG